MDKKEIQIVIPTCNSSKDLDVTMESIRRQDYNPENIFVTIVDFGSEDGTYEKALNYERKHIGVYTRPFQKNWRLRISDAARIVETVGLGELGRLFIVLYPGDIMYPDCLLVMSDKYTENCMINPGFICCESDIFTNDGKVEKQKPLFSEDRLIVGRREKIREYVTRGYKHQIFSMTQKLFTQRHKRCYQKNEGRCWNRLMGQSTVYIQKPLVCTKRIVYEDELQEILYRWEDIMALCRMYSNTYESDFDESLFLAAVENLSEYALWRSFCSYQNNVDRRTVEDCFLISRVISSGIENKEIYWKMQKLVQEHDTEMVNALEQYFREQN